MPKIFVGIPQAIWSFACAGAVTNIGTVTVATKANNLAVCFAFISDPVHISDLTVTKGPSEEVLCTRRRINIIVDDGSPAIMDFYIWLVEIGRPEALRVQSFN